MKKNLKRKLVLLIILGIPIILLFNSNISLDHKALKNIRGIRKFQNSYENIWTPNGTAICIANNTQFFPEICSDGIGGAIITWYDLRNDEGDIYVQRINSSGITQWESNGTEICSATGGQLYPQICSDGTGGAIITWQDERKGSALEDIYVQRIDVNGDIQWTTNGVPICTIDGRQSSPQICSDGAGGAIITWDDTRSDAGDIFVQKISSSGKTQWNSNGTAICIANSTQWSPQICSDGIGGAIITWGDTRNDASDIFVQRINSSGKTQWKSNGTAICAATGRQFYPQICKDGVGGAIITWPDNRSGNFDIYAQKLDINGNIQWTTNGTAICTAPKSQVVQSICNDGVGGAIITWTDCRDVTNHFESYDIYAQRIGANGNIQWNTNGIPICTDYYDQSLPKICKDGAGGAIITWEDQRSGAGGIYIQRVGTNGNIHYTTNGIPICTAIGSQSHSEICSDGAGGAIITWMDGRNDPGRSDIYAQRVETIQLLNIKISNQLFSTDKFNISFFIYTDNGEGIATAEIQMWWNGTNVSDNVSNLGNGLYFVSLEPITVAFGDDPIMLNMTITADGYHDKYFETYLAIDPDTLSKGKGSPLTKLIIIIISIVSGIGIVVGISLYLLHKRMQTNISM